jgi:hypothetical protein
MYSTADYLADQLRAQNKAQDWVISEIDRASELGAIFALRGVTDLKNLTLGMRSKRKWSEDSGLTSENEFYFLNGEKVIGFINTPEYPFEIENGRLKVGWSARGKGNVGYYLNATASGVQISAEWASSSDWGTFRDVAKFVVMAGVSIVLPGLGIALGQTLGAAIVGAEFAAAYPALTTAIGNISISTAMNGGDVESAIKAAALGEIGGFAGANVSSAVISSTGLNSLALVAGAATKAFVVSGDIKQAVIASVLQQGAKAQKMDETNFDFGSVEWGDNSQNIFSGGGGFDTGSINDVFTIPDISTVPQPIADFGFEDVKWGSGGAIPSAFPSAGFQPLFPQAEITAPIPKAVGSEFSISSVINSVSSAALQALGLVRAYKMVNSPAVNKTARAVAVDGSVVVATNDGFVKTKTVAGGVTYSKVPVGSPQSTLDGSIVINNGDGTYTKISATGETKIYTYGAAPADSGGVSSALTALTSNSNNILMLGGLALGAFFLLKKSR